MAILVATDGASHAALALTFGAYIARAQNQTLTVLTVVKRENERDKANTILETAAFILAPLQVKYHTKTRVGHPAEEILAEAEAEPYFMVIMSDRQHRGLWTRFLLGSTAQRVVEHAPCPAVIVKGQIGEVRRALICDSGAPQSRIIERVAEQLAPLLQNTNRITVLHVMSHISAGMAVDGHLIEADAGQLIAEQAPEGTLFTHDLSVLHDEGLNAAPKVRHGRVVDEVMAEAREGNYDLVIIGANAGTGWRRILLDDITHQLVTEMDRPILIVR